MVRGICCMRTHVELAVCDVISRTAQVGGMNGTSEVSSMVRPENVKNRSVSCW